MQHMCKPPEGHNTLSSTAPRWGPTSRFPEGTDRGYLTGFGFTTAHSGHEGFRGCDEGRSDRRLRPFRRAQETRGAAVKGCFRLQSGEETLGMIG